MNNNTKRILAVDSIKKKLVGRRLTYKEIYNLMEEIANERLGDILTTYFVAAGFKEGFSPSELYFLTKAMVETGTHLKFDGIVADKHSTGGLSGSRASMIIVPIIAAAGFKIPKTSSRAITTPAGTADVMELLANVNLTPHQVTQVVEEIGGCIVWNGHLGLAPADDVIIQVEEPLAFESFDKVIVSIMAKKAAVGANHVIFDIPIGPTMKIRYQKDAQIIAHKFKELGRQFNMKVVADINETYQPAGNGIGPYLEAIDVLKVLEQKKDRPVELEERALRLAGKLLDSCFETQKSDCHGLDTAKELLQSGKALQKFKDIILAQGGKADVASGTLTSPAHRQTVHSPLSGTIISINNYNLNAVAKILGAPKDKFAGIFMHAKRPDKIKTNDSLLELHSTSKHHISEAQSALKNFPIFEIR